MEDEEESVDSSFLNYDNLNIYLYTIFMNGILLFQIIIRLATIIALWTKFLVSYHHNIMKSFAYIYT